MDAGVVEQLGASLAPDIVPQLQEIVASIPAEVFAELAPVPAPTGVIALAQRPRISAWDVMQTAGSDPVILLERPRNPFNIGAAVPGGGGGRGGRVRKHRRTGPVAPVGGTLRRGAAVPRCRWPVATPSRVAAGRCWRSIPGGRPCDRKPSLPVACSRSATSGTGSATSWRPRPKGASRYRWSRGYPASTLRQQWRWLCIPGA